MKHIFLALFALTACVASAFAQTSPAATASVSLTKEDRQTAINYLQETEKNFLAAINGLSDAHCKLKAAPDRWSIAQVAEHIATAEDFFWSSVGNMMQEPANPERASETAGKDKIIFDKVPDRSHKAQAPEPLKLTGKFATREELVKHLLHGQQGHQRIEVTISIGLSTLELKGEAVADVLKRADTALYRAKHDGRNSVSAAA